MQKVRLECTLSPPQSLTRSLFTTGGLVAIACERILQQHGGGSFTAFLRFLLDKYATTTAAQAADPSRALTTALLLEELLSFAPPPAREQLEGVWSAYVTGNEAMTSTTFAAITAADLERLHDWKERYYPAFEPASEDQESARHHNADL